MHLSEEGVDEPDMTVLHEEVGRLDVAVGQPGLPEAPDDRQPLVDDGVVDRDLADLPGAVEEFGDEQILPFRAELDAAERLGHRHPGVAEQPQRIILLGHQPPDTVERLLVLQPAYSSSRPSLYQRSARRWLRAYSLANR
jgi:hypothetical protein